MSYQKSLLRDEGLLKSRAQPTNHHHYIETSHDGISHDSLTNLGYDWSRVADPGIAPKPPRKVYLPRTTEDVIHAILQAQANGEPVVVRGHGHSSNNLVTPDRGVVVLTDLMNRVLNIDPDAMTVTIQGGATLMMVDLLLSETGLGLSIIGDHDHITAAGFASVGGISPASHRHGMFVDTVQAIEYVDWTGKAHRCSRTERTDDLMRVLCGLGKHGIITELTVNIVRIDKFKTVLENRRHITPSLNDFVRYSGDMIRNPGDAVMERGVWADFDLPVVSGLPVAAGLSLRLGQFSSYHPTSQSLLKSWWNDLAYGVQHKIGYWAGRLPTAVDDFVKYIGMGCIMFSPRYAGMKNIERFTDQILDATVGDPTRMFVVLAPAERYETLFHQLLEAVVAERRRSGAITFISVYVKSIRSPYLAGGDPNKRYCEIMLYIGVRPEKMTDRILNHLVGTVDRLVMGNGAFRYLHSLTSEDPEIRAKVDPNAQYSRPAESNGRAKAPAPELSDKPRQLAKKAAAAATAANRNSPARGRGAASSRAAGNGAATSRTAGTNAASRTAGSNGTAVTRSAAVNRATAPSGPSTSPGRNESGAGNGRAKGGNQALRADAVLTPDGAQR